MIASTNNNTSINVYNNAFCEALQKRIENIMNKMQIEHNDESKRVCYIYNELSLKEYNEWIDDLNKELINTTEKNHQDLLRKEIEYINRDKQRLINFENKLNNKRAELIQKFSYPIDSAINLITKNINSYQQDLLNCIFESFINKIKSMCPDDENYDGTIKSVYQEKESQKVINLFNSLTNRLIDGFTKLLNSIGSNEFYSQDIKRFDTLTKLVREIDYTCEKIYMQTIIDSIDNKINQYPSNQMTTSLLVKSYSRTLMTNINSYIIKELSKEIDDEIKNSFIKIYELMNHIMPKPYSTETNDEGFFQSPEPKVLNKPMILSKQSIIVEKTLDDFIDSLPNEPADINQLTELYNKFFTDKNITNRGLGMILSKVDRLNKSTRWEKSKKIIYYKKI